MSLSFVDPENFLEGFQFLIAAAPGEGLSIWRFTSLGLDGMFPSVFR